MKNMLKKQKRIAILVPSMRGGGAERVALNLAQGITERGYPVDLVLAQAEGPYLSEIPESVRVVDLKSSRMIKSIPALARYLQTEIPVALLSIMNHVNIVAVWARRLARVQTRVIVSEHTLTSKLSENTTKWGAWFILQLMKHSYKGAEAIVSVTGGVAEELSQISGISRKRIQVIYNPNITPEVKENARAPLDHPWFKPGEPPVLLSAGRMVSLKDFPLLIKAFNQVRRTRSVRLIIFGEGEKRAELEAMVQKLGLSGSVSLPGFVENLHAYMKRARLVVLTSKWEASSNVLSEALYCGAQIISTDCPYGPREILQGGKYGKLVPVGNVPVLARAIENALDNPKPNAPQESWQPFELDNVINQYLRLLLGNSGCVN